MFYTLKKHVQVRLYVLGFVIAITLVNFSTGAKYEFDECETQDKSPGICRLFSECQPLIDGIKSGTISIHDPKHCGYKGPNEIICCPMAGDAWPPKSGTVPLLFGSMPNTLTTTTTTTTTTAILTTSPSSPIIQPTQIKVVRTDRPAVEACRIIQEDLGVVLTPHILDGTPVNPGDYPHMAAIGYTTIGNEGGPYDFRCGGTLIHERFVLTAAHCMNNRNAEPAIVRLGMSNFDDAEELVNKYEVPIKNVHIHPQFSQLNKIHDIALLEFEKPVPKNRYISPTCLYTDSKDPSAEDMLYVAGWGVYNYTTKIKSNALLKTRMYLVSDDFCRDSYRVQGITLQSEHMCATDPKNSADACWGDSGGPLLLHVDESILDFRLVGIIAAGYGCAGSIPGLYMRVSMYLDWIENIVWPSN